MAVIHDCRCSKVSKTRKKTKKTLIDEMWNGRFVLHGVPAKFQRACSLKLCRNAVHGGLRRGGGGAHISLILPYVTSLGSGVPTSVIRLIWDEWCGPTRAFLLHLPNLFYRLAACPLIAVAAKSCLVILSLFWSIDDSTMAHNLRHRPSIELALEMCVEPISRPTEFYLICLVVII